MITITHTTIAHQGGENIVNDAHFTVPTHTICTIIGPNGVGKSSLMREIWQSQFRKQKGITLPLQRAYIPQNMIDIDFKIKDMPTIWDIIFQYESSEYEHQDYEPEYQQRVLEWYCDVIEHTPSDYEQRLMSTMRQIGLHTAAMTPTFGELSPGSKKKLLLAILFASQPHAILGDELTNHLDAQAIDILAMWLQKSSAASLIIDHSQDLVSAVSKDFLVLEKTVARKPRIYSHTTLESLLEDLEKRRELQEQEQKTADARQAKIEADIKLKQRQVEVYGAAVGKAVQTLKKKLEREITSREALNEFDSRKDITFATSKQSSKIKSDLIASFEDLEYKIGIQKIQAIDELRLYKGTRYRIIGPNGSGKSTLISLLEAQLAGTLHEHTQYIEGQITLGSTIKDKSIYIMRQRSQYETYGSIEDFILERVNISPHSIKGFLKQLQIDKDQTDLTSHLSLGQIIRLELAIIARIMPTLEVLILDEPGNYLDIYMQRSLSNLLKQFKGGLIFISHDSTLARAIGYDEIIDMGITFR